MKRYTPFLMFALYIMTSCTSSQRPENPEQWTDDQVAKWFDGKEWLGTAALAPDPSIDQKQFATHYYEHKDRWDKAFDFLQKTDLSSLTVGNHEIDGKDVFAIISEYNTKDPEAVNYESHEKYTDVHSMISGNEYIGSKNASASDIATPYNEERDVTLYQNEGGENLLAAPGKFFIFFPDNVHRPGLKVEESMPVKKLVIKVRN